MSPARRRRLRELTGLFGPASITWRINREAVLLLGGRRALLLQAAHPLEAWTKQRYQRALKNVLDKLAKMVSGA